MCKESGTDGYIRARQRLHKCTRHASARTPQKPGMDAAAQITHIEAYNARGDSAGQSTRGTQLGFAQMGDNFDVTMIIFAALALFVVWKLRSVLGTRTGNEPRPDPMSRRPGQPANSANDEGNVVRLPGAGPERRPPPLQPAAARPRDENRWDGLAARDSQVWEGLDQAVAADPTFDPRVFLDGAKSAYEMIITAFARGDRQTLRGLLSKEVFDSFSQALSEREAQGNRVDTTFVSIDKADITDVQVRGKMLQVAVSFTSKLITATFDRNGAVIDGNPDKVVDVGDLWTFAHDISSRDPNWALIGT